MGLETIHCRPRTSVPEREHVQISLPAEGVGHHPPEPSLVCRHLPAPSGAALRAKAPPFGYLAPLDSYVPMPHGHAFL